MEQPTTKRSPDQMREPVNPTGDAAIAPEALTPEKLIDLIYPELRRFAAVQLAREKPAATWQATALVHEAWFRLAHSGSQFKDKSHFFAIAAETMRRVLVERARRRQAQRHGGGQEPVQLGAVEIAAPANDERLLQVHDALDGLAAEDPVKAQVVKLRFFVGMNTRETAQVLGLSERSVERHWAYAKAWLYAAIQRNT